MVKTTQVTDKLSISPQPDLSDFERFSADGYRLVINNRPDGEEAAQPGSAAELKAATSAGMDYRHIPVTGPTITETDIREFQRAIAESRAPVLAHCKSGTRALTLWVLGEVLDQRMRITDVEPFGNKLGFDLKGAVAWLSKHSKKDSA